MRTALWPASWNWRSLLSTTVWPEMDVGRGGVDAELDPQRASLSFGARELGFERAFGKHLDGADEKVVDKAAVGHRRR